MSAVRSWRHHPLVRLLSSLRFGVTLIGVILLYASVMSAVPQWRGVLEMTEMQAFRHWVFFALIALLCVSVTVATLARIRFTLFNAGVLTVHAGLLLLCLSSIWYFGTKVEGDVLLRSPRVELLSLGGQNPRVLAAFRPAMGERWSATMPAFGGDVSLEVVEADRDEDGDVRGVALRTKLGDAAATTIKLTPDAAIQPLGQRLALQFVTFPAERRFYDSERPALYWHNIGDPVSALKSAEIRGLPLFCTRYVDEGYVLTDRDGAAVPSGRTRPAIPLPAGLALPTSWFERWRLPIRVLADELPFDVEITGFAPYIAEMREAAVPDIPAAAPNPALDIKLALPGSDRAREHTLFAHDPAAAVLDFPTPIEFRWATTPQEREEWLAPLAGADELWIEVKNPPVQKRVAIAAGQSIAIEGTSYRVQVQQLFPDWPLMSPGFEQARSPAALVEVESAEKRFTRTVIQRFPRLSQDIDETGMRRREGPYDSNIVLRYRTSANGWVQIIGDADSARSGRIEVGVFDQTGAIARHTLAIGQKRAILLAGTPVELTAARLLEHARRVTIPVIEPVESRRANFALRSASAIRLRFTGRDSFAGWAESQWCTFSQYPHIEAQPIIVRPPGSSTAWEFTYSRLSHDLDAALIGGQLGVTFFPGRQSVESWRSDFSARPAGRSDVLKGSVQTNETWSLGQWTFFQSGAAKDHWSYTILGVGNRRGIWPMVLGCCLITLGCLFAFYVKPVLRRRQRERALSEAAARPAVRRAVGAAVESPGLIEVTT